METGYDCLENQFVTIIIDAASPHFTTKRDIADQLPSLAAVFAKTCTHSQTNLESSPLYHVMLHHMCFHASVWVEIPLSRLSCPYPTTLAGRKDETRKSDESQLNWLWMRRHRKGIRPILSCTYVCVSSFIWISFCLIVCVNIFW